jgi:choline dehydrogenase-like flavoprotein
VARRGGERLAVRARREVILAAGSIESPQLLERSGIGDPVVLTRAGVEPRVESPHVGERLLEHRGMTVQARLRPGLGLNRRLNTLPRLLCAGAGYVLTRRGPVATGPFALVGQLRSAPGEPRPDVQILLTPMSLDLGTTRLRLARHAGMMIQGYQLRPTTPSAVHIRSADPADPPVIEARYLETELDRTVTGRILARLRGMIAEGPLADLVIGEDAPGPDVVTPEQAVEYARATGIGIYHAVGSCAMGPNDEDVVDARLRVRGVRGLRVVDASVFPAMPSGNTAAPTMALAWRAADLVGAEA